MIVWQEMKSETERPAVLLIRIDLNLGQGIETKLLAVVGQRLDGRWQGLVTRNAIFPDEDVAIQLGKHSSKDAAKVEVQEHLGIEEVYNIDEL